MIRATPTRTGMGEKGLDVQFLQGRGCALALNSSLSPQRGQGPVSGINVMPLTYGGGISSSYGLTPKFW
jgi:hypothetical protein